jgi:hypothetical protein
MLWLENTTMDLLNISANFVSCAGLVNITQLLESMTQLKTIGFCSRNPGIFNDQDATHHFVSKLQQKKLSVHELPGIAFPHEWRASIQNSLARNPQLNRVALLLVPLPLPPPPPPPPLLQRQQQQQQQQHATSMMLKISHKVITKFATVPNIAGASAIFKLFAARRQLLEKRTKRPTATAVAATTATGSSNDAGSPTDGHYPTQH